MSNAIIVELAKVDPDQPGVKPEDIIVRDPDTRLRLEPGKQYRVISNSFWQKKILQKVVIEVKPGQEKIEEIKPVDSTSNKNKNK